MTEVNARTHALYDAWRQAAAGDTQLATDLREYEARRRIDVATGLALIHGGPVDERTVDAVWAVLGTEVYSKLVNSCDWSPPDYEAFAQAILTALLPEVAPRE